VIATDEIAGPLLAQETEKSKADVYETLDLFGTSL